MIKVNIAIVLGDKIIAKIQSVGKTYDEVYENAFKYADETFGVNPYELFDIAHPRHQVLFENELNQLFKE